MITSNKYLNYSYLNSLISKLSNSLNFKKLRYGGKNVEDKIKVLKERFPTINESKIIGLAILLQHFNLDIFSDEEINAVFDYDLPISGLNINQYIDPVLTFDKGTFDNQSSRNIHQMIDLELEDSSNIDQLLSKNALTPKAIIENLINKN